MYVHTKLVQIATVVLLENATVGYIKLLWSTVDGQRDRLQLIIVAFQYHATMTCKVYYNTAMDVFTVVYHTSMIIYSDRLCDPSLSMSLPI